MERTNVYGLDGKKRSLIDKPEIFKVKPREDLIIKASETSQSKTKQIQGRDKRAGFRNTAEGWGTGHGLSRAPRRKGSGYPTAKNVARVPFAVGGRVAHPIKVEKNIIKRINKKTYNLSIISAISASGDPLWLKRRGYKIENILELPFVVDDKIQSIKKTNHLYSTLKDLGLIEELTKVKESKKVRAGKGKRRGRKYKKKRGFLIVIKDDFGIVKAARNIPGTDIKNVNDLSIDHLAPGGSPGRLILWTQSAFNELKTKFKG